jgi:hypothetical protein
VYDYIKHLFQGVPVQTIERELCSTQILKNYGICVGGGGGVYRLLKDLDHLLEVSEGMVYPLQKSESVCRPKLVESITDYRKTDSTNSGTCRILPAGSESHYGFHCEQDGAVEEGSEVKWKIKSGDDASVSGESYGCIDASDVWNTKEKTEEGV